jgi:hypothetical protein
MTWHKIAVQIFINSLRVVEDCRTKAGFADSTRSKDRDPRGFLLQEVNDFLQFGFAAVEYLR